MCNKAVIFTQKSFLSQLSSAITKTFNSEFGPFEINLNRLAQDIRDEASIVSQRVQSEEVKTNSRFRDLAIRFSDSASQELQAAKRSKKQKRRLRFLNACSTYNYQLAWKQARKKGHTSWVFDQKPYKEWKRASSSCTLWCTGTLGSGKTVLSANIVDDLILSDPTIIVVHFFCRYDELESLKTRTIIGSIGRQIFEGIDFDFSEQIPEIESGDLETAQIMQYLEELSISNSSKRFIVIDGLDECEESEARNTLNYLNQFIESNHGYHIYCSSRPDIAYWGTSLLRPKWKLSMSAATGGIEQYIEGALAESLESERLCLGDSKIIETIYHELVAKAGNMSVSCLSNRTDI